MADLQKALETQLKHIETRAGRPLPELVQAVTSSGLSKHGEMVALLKTRFGLGHGDANTVVHFARRAHQPAPAAEDALDGLYTGAKASLRPIHDRLLAALKEFGDFEAAPKKSYVSYRRKKQFATIGPGAQTRVDLGLNVKGLPPSARLEALPAGQMCNYRIKLTGADQVDAALISWIKAAYDAAG